MPRSFFLLFWARLFANVVFGDDVLIRTSYPVSPMKQLRLRLDLATRRTRRALEQRRRSILTQVSEVDRHKAAAGDVYLRLRWREDISRRRSLFEAFYDQYDELIGLLCLAAHQGIEPHQEDEYGKRRAWFASNYPHRVQGVIAPYLTSDASDSMPGIWGRGRRGCDAFEALYLPPTIAAMLEADGGNLIGRMMRTQEALMAWDAQLAREEAAVDGTVRYH